MPIQQMVHLRPRPPGGARRSISPSSSSPCSAATPASLSLDALWDESPSLPESTPTAANPLAPCLPLVPAPSPPISCPPTEICHGASRRTGENDWASRHQACTCQAVFAHASPRDARKRVGGWRRPGRSPPDDPRDLSRDESRRGIPTRTSLAMPNATTPSAYRQYYKTRNRPVYEPRVIWTGATPQLNVW